MQKKTSQWHPPKTRRRLTRAEQGHILRQMVTLARLLTEEGMPPPSIPHALARLRDDLVAACCAGTPVVSVDWESYLQACRGSAQQAAGAEGSGTHEPDHD